jgi:hypothetical protein
LVGANSASRFGIVINHVKGSGAREPAIDSSSTLGSRRPTARIVVDENLPVRNSTKQIEAQVSTCLRKYYRHKIHSLPDLFILSRLQKTDDLCKKSYGVPCLRHQNSGRGASVNRTFVAAELQLPSHL